MEVECNSNKCEGVVRHTIQKATGIVEGLYSRAEQYPVFQTTLQSTLKLYKPLAPVVEPVVQRVVAVADPWVDSVDSVLTETWNTVNKKVIDPARKKNPSGHVSLVGVCCEVGEIATIEIRNRYSSLLDLSDHAVDVLLPESEPEPEFASKNASEEKREKHHPKSLVEVSSKAQKRVFKRIEHQWQNVRVFSGGRLKEIIHIDLAEYVENGYTFTVSFTNERVYPIVNNLTSTAFGVVDNTRKFSAEKSKLLWDAIARFRELSCQSYNQAYKYASDKAEAMGVPTLVQKTKEVSLGEVSEYVLVKLNIKQQNDQFVITQNKVFDLFRALAGLIIYKDANKPIAPPADNAAVAQKTK